jgi:hypothetical protein
MVKKPKKPTKKIEVKDLDTTKNPKGGVMLSPERLKRLG